MATYRTTESKLLNVTAKKVLVDQSYLSYFGYEGVDLREVKHLDVSKNRVLCLGIPDDAMDDLEMIYRCLTPFNFSATIIETETGPVYRVWGDRHILRTPDQDYDVTYTGNQKIDGKWRNSELYLTPIKNSVLS